MSTNNIFDIAINRVCLNNPEFSYDDFGTLYTDAFWKLQYEIYMEEASPDSLTQEKDYGFIDEIVACLLGGYGLKAEVGWAAYKKLKYHNLIRRGVVSEEVAAILSEPLNIGGKWIHYRFPLQKSKYISDFLCRDDLDVIPINDDLSFRAWLLTINGIGPKTASWITRNYLHSDRVAIIDIHLYRAGILTGFINPRLNIHKDYFEIERCFLDYCESLQVRPSIMDMVMWLNMKNTNRIAISLINKI